MRFGFLVTLITLLKSLSVAAADDARFAYNGFRPPNQIILDGIAGLTPDGLLQLTNLTRQQQGHAFYPRPLHFKNSTNGSAFSFSTTFVFAIHPQYESLRGQSQGIAFVIAPTRGLPGALPNQYLGLFNESNNGNRSNRVVAVEFDTTRTVDFGDINDNHVGININGLRSDASAPAGYYEDGGKTNFMNLTLISGQRMQVWIEYFGLEKKTDVTLAPFNAPKPKTPLVSLSRDLSAILDAEMYIGFSSATGTVLTSNYILGWSFKVSGHAQELVLSQLPTLPQFGPKQISHLLTVGLPVIVFSLGLLAVLGAIFYIRRKRMFAEVFEDWEVEYGPHKFKYKDLYIATKGFKDKELLGSGGFGRVYRGVLPATKIEIAVKAVTHDSSQGMKEFVAEIASMGRLQHRNIVHLLGYCRRKGELLLVYDYMPNGSLDKYLYNRPNVTLDWGKRFKVIKGVALGLFYLHEQWEQVVIHRDVKASNVLLDGEFNGRLGDFGLARLYERGTDPKTTHVVGTFGYLAPEYARTGKATPRTDVFAFGAFCLEVATGRRPIESHSQTEVTILVQWVHSCWETGSVLDAKDPNLGSDYAAEEVELVLKLGLICSHSNPEARPTMRQCVQYLQGEIPFHGIPSLDLSSGGLAYGRGDGFTDFTASYSSSVAESILSGAR
ncbi:hypothetical protein DM860_012188 [Cuscuta australis]|uniref:non-specific serine/threonine protein kinase n=2 Tax=Cuscuta sect. Cleistogrammica TaxID=1824901 RepID=A0A328EAI2_9ASTE|nr:hypothetical protein DM860_012188 [Cuscuta australis]